MAVRAERVQRDPLPAFSSAVREPADAQRRETCERGRVNRREVRLSLSATAGASYFRGVFTLSS